MFGLILLVTVCLVATFFFFLLISLFKLNNQERTYQMVKKETRDCESTEDSEGDGLVLFDDPMFPPEFDND
jgi:hypothetical protein